MVHERLRPVVVENMDAMALIKREDAPGTLFYLDPPYLHETRATTGEYAHEMSNGQHAALLNVLENVRGKFLLSGYHSDLYDAAAMRCGWKVHEFDLPNNAAGGAEKRRMVEVVYANF